MLFIEKMQSQLEKKDNLKLILEKRKNIKLLDDLTKQEEERFLFLLKKVNDSAEKAAKYLYDHMDLWYSLGLVDEFSDEFNCEYYTYGGPLEVRENFYAFFDEIVMDPKTFEFNILELKNIMEIKLENNKPIFYIPPKKKKERKGWIKRNEYKRFPLEKLIIEWGTLFLIYNLHNLISKDEKIITFYEEKYENKIVRAVNNIIRALEYIIYETKKTYYLYSTKNIYSTKEKIEKELFVKNKLRLPTFDVLKRDNRYIKRLEADSSYNPFQDLKDLIEKLKILDFTKNNHEEIKLKTLINTKKIYDDIGTLREKLQNDFFKIINEVIQLDEELENDILKLIEIVTNPVLCGIENFIIGKNIKYYIKIELEEEEYDFWSLPQKYSYFYLAEIIN